MKSMKESTMLHKSATAVIPLCLVLGFALLMTSFAHAAKMYKWIDKDGNISYQDQPPPEKAKVLTEKTFKETSALSSSNADKQAVIVYITDNCAMCELVVARLMQNNVPYQTKSMKDRTVQKEILAKTDSLLVPTVEINGALFTDNDKAALEKNLTDAGYQLANTSSTPPSNNP